MAVLMLLRHAKSSWSAGEAVDHERPLMARGIRAASVMGRFLTRCGQQPDVVITSTAVRARNTAELAAEAGHWNCEIRAVSVLYGCEPNAVVGELTATAGLPERVLIVGHEPTWSGLVALLGGGRVRMPTAAVACLEFGDRSWPQIGPGQGVLRWLVTPKLVQGMT